ncbi:MAG: TlpA family protein disulfide reductase [Planctomycetes bacterium]|nr:TlpA family protein disulfide reductase [Planctomycetota bacterium]
MLKKAIFAVLVVLGLVWIGCSDSNSGGSSSPASARGGGGSSSSRSGPSQHRPSPGEAGISLFRLPMLDGQPVTVRTPAALYFFTTWCGNCDRVMPQIKLMTEKARSLGWRVYGIDVDEPPARVSAYVQRVQPNFPVLLDLDGRVATQYRIAGYPTFILVDKNGSIIYQGHRVPSNF